MRRYSNKRFSDRFQESRAARPVIVDWMRPLSFLVLASLASVASAEARTIVLGIQPLSLPPAVVAETLLHDRILTQALAKAGVELRSQPYGKGGEMIADLGSGRLAGALFGDMPTLTAAVRSEIRVIGMVKHSFSSVVARRYQRIADLAGARIGYAEGGALYTLLQGLASGGLGEDEVTLVPLEVSEMPAALERGEIDAFAAWEPAPSIARQRIPSAAVIYRGLTTAYFALNGPFAQERPEAAAALGAALVRAVAWLRSDERNVKRAAGWSIKAREIFNGRPSDLTEEAVAELVHSDLLEPIGLPYLYPVQLESDGLLAGEFRFLQGQGKLPSDASWETVRNAFVTDYLPAVKSEAGTLRYDYRTDDAGLWPGD